MKPDEQRDYWDAHIADWDASAYEQKPSLPWLERFATPFRGLLRARRDYAAALLARAGCRSVLELGCGTGELLASLPASSKLDRYVGVDISRVAIDKARARTYAVTLATPPDFRASSIAELDTSAGEGFDLVLGLGITPYLSDEEFERLAQLIGPAAFVLDYHAAGLTPKNALHWVYRKLVRFPFYRLFSDDEIAGLLGRLGVEDFEIAKEPGLSFVQRLPA